MGVQLATRQRQVLDGTLALITPIAERAGSCFYGRLFSQAPHVLPLFRRDLSRPELAPAAAHRFLQLLTITIEASGDGGQGTATVHGARTVDRLAERHVGYRIDPEHYVPMRAALLWTLQAQLGPEFTAEHRSAWESAYDHLVERMVEVYTEMTG